MSCKESNKKKSFSTTSFQLLNSSRQSLTIFRDKSTWKYSFIESKISNKSNASPGIPVNSPRNWYEVRTHFLRNLSIIFPTGFPNYFYDGWDWHSTLYWKSKVSVAKSLTIVVETMHRLPEPSQWDWKIEITVSDSLKTWSEAFNHPKWAANSRFLAWKLIWLLRTTIICKPKINFQLINKLIQLNLKSYVIKL